MRRSPMRSASRFLAISLLAGFSFATVGGPLGLYGCHRHDAAAAAPADTPHEHHSHGAPASQGDNGQQSDRCGCVGMCTQPAPALLPTDNARPAALETMADIVASPDDANVATHLAFLPFATGPPPFLA